MLHKNKNTLTNNNNTKLSDKAVQKTEQKATNRIKNWSVYNAGLINRGAFIDLAKAAIKEADRESRRRHTGVGRPKQYQDAIILVIAVYREVYQFTFREAVGFAKDVFGALGIKTPHYSTLARRMYHLEIDLHIDRRRLKGGAVLLVDSTGYKSSGEGEWKVRKHGASKKRGWTKTHYLVEFGSLQVLSMSVTPDYVGDNLEVPNLIEHLPENIRVNELLGDGAYNSKALCKLADELQIQLISPPRRGGRNTQKQYVGANPAHVKRCEEIGREEWKNEVGYHRRSLVETNMFRFKAVFSDKVKARSAAGQETELRIRAMVLNIWTNKWMPKYTKT